MRATTQGVEQNEGFDQQPVGRHTALRVPAPVQVGHRRGKSVGLIEAEAEDAIVAFARQALDVLHEGLFEPPCRLGAVVIPGWRLPLTYRCFLSLEIRGDPLAAGEMLVCGKATEATELEEVTLAYPSRRPAQPAVGEDDRPA